MAGNDCDGWRDKLVGKILLDNEQESTLSEGEYIYKKDLPQPNRIVKPGSFVTMDFKPNRLNVHVDDRMKVTGVKYG